MRSENRPDLAYNSGNVMILQKKQNSNRSRFDMATVDPDNSGRSPDKGSRHGNGFSLASRTKIDQIREFTRRAILGLDRLQSQGLGKRRHVDRIDVFASSFFQK